MSNLLSRLQSVNLPQKESEPVLSGRLTRVVGLTLEAVGLNVPVEYAVVLIPHQVLC